MTIKPPLPGLLTASFRGVSFFIPDTVTSTVGRRVAAHYFPGLDFAAYDDHGKAAEKIAFEAIYIGDDYIAHGKRLKDAFETAGPGTLMHPWFGAMTVILTEPAELSFSSTELRCVRISVNFERINDGAQSAGLTKATSPALVASGVELARAAFSLIDGIQGNTLSRLRSDATARAGHHYVDFFNTLKSPAASSLRAALPQNVPTSPQTFARLFEGLSSSLVDMTLYNASLSAVAPAADAQAASNALTAESALGIVLQAASLFGDYAMDAPSITDKALYIAATADLMGKGMMIAADINPASAKAAIAIRQQITEALDLFSNSLQSLFETALSGAASRLYRATAEARLRIVADINETIGRLPQTTRIVLSRDIDAWALANLFYGDDPVAIEAGYEDLIKRNRPRHPAMLEAGVLEILPVL